MGQMEILSSVQFNSMKNQKFNNHAISSVTVNLNCKNNIIVGALGFLFSKYACVTFQNNTSFSFNIIADEMCFISLGRARGEGKGEGFKGAWSIFRVGRKYE